MQPLPGKLIPVLLAAVFLPGWALAATTVFQWKDEDGNVHFSDTAPAGENTPDIREITFDDFDDKSEDRNQYSIIDQAEQMAEWHRQTTAEQLARKQLSLEEQRLNLEMESTRLNELYMEREYSRPLTSFYGFPGPYLYHQRRHDHYQPGNQRFRPRFDRRPPARAVPGAQSRPRGVFRAGISVGL